MTLYGLSVEAWTDMLISQSGLCAICGRQMTKRTEPGVDHDHVTGAVRGLLCARCNTALPIIEDRDLMASAVLYLETHGRIPETEAVSG